MKKPPSILRGALLAFLLFAAAGPAAAGTLRYMMWDANQRPVYQQCAKRFELAHPGIRIRIVQQGWDDYWTTLSAGMVSETAPDVFVNHLSKYPDLVANGQLVDLAPLIRRDGVDPKSFVDGLYPLWGRDNHQGQHQYGLPKDWDTVALIVNLDLAAQAGVSADQLRELDWNPKDGGSFGRLIAHLTIDEQGRNALSPGFDKSRVKVRGYQNPGPGGMSGQTEWGSFAVANGFAYQDSPWNANFHYDDPRLAQTLSWFASLYARGISAAPREVGKLGAEAMFVAGKAAIVPNGSWMIGHFARNTRFRSLWVTMPRGPGGERVSMLNGLADSIWIGSKQKVDAWQWVRYLASNECQSLVAASGVVFPAIRGLAEQVVAAQGRAGIDSRAFLAMAAAQTFAPPIADHGDEIHTIMDSAMQAILFGGADAALTLRAANARVKAVFGH
jgi:multiple sugar transport system substrate-binding protein